VSRLLDNEALLGLQNWAGYHLGEQHHASIDPTAAGQCSEVMRARFLPHIFGLMPIAATYRSSPYIEVKPIIAEHLESLGIESKPSLVAIIKDLCDNFDRTRRRVGAAGIRPRKSTISDLRQLPDLHKNIRARQGHRCAVCGTQFSVGENEETLDHVIPWRLGGDPPGGWNWQLLCRRCNCAKDTLLACYVAPEYMNWVFPDLLNHQDWQGEELSERGRYLMLRHYAQCQAPRCASSPTQAKLFVARKSRLGFSVFDHLVVVCEAHRDIFGAIVG
jgi:5-methylcytosine-specific restriction endonuclease McrA